MKCAYRQRGFNLVEAAVVLAIVGFVIGAVWVAAAAVTSSKKINDTQDDILYIFERLSDLNSKGRIASECENAANMLISMGIIPSPLISGTDFVNRWGGPMTLLLSGDRLDITLENIPKDACIKLAVGLSVRGRNSALSMTTVNDESFTEVIDPIAANVACESETYPDGAYMSWTFGLSDKLDFGGGAAPAIACAPPLP